MEFDKLNAMEIVWIFEWVVIFTGYYVPEVYLINLKCLECNDYCGLKLFQVHYCRSNQMAYQRFHPFYLRMERIFVKKGEKNRKTDSM